MLNLIKRVYDFFYFLIRPGYWIMTSQYSKEWDDILNKLMLEHRFVPTRMHVAKLGETEIWIANHPHGSFKPNRTGVRVRPSRRTIVQAHKKLVRDLFLVEPVQRLSELGALKQIGGDDGLEPPDQELFTQLYKHPFIIDAAKKGEA